MGEVEVTLALGPVVTFEVGPQFHLGAPGGTSFKIFIGVSHKDIPGMTKGSLSLLLDSGRVDMTLKFDLAERGRFSLSHTYNAPWNFKTSAIAVYVPLDMAWGAEHEVVVREDELRHWLNVSWSALPSDKFTSLIHFVSHSETRADLSLRALLMYPGQVFELQETLAEALGGSYKNKLTLRLHPGRALNMDTIIITRANNEVFSYGLSNTLKLDSWISPVSLVGTFNCFGKGQCSIVVTAEQAGDELLDMELQHTTARGISRTEAKIIITHWFDGTVSLDTAYKIGYCDLKWYMLVWKWKRLLQGRAEVDFANTDVAVAEMQVQKLLDDGQLAHVTHAYNGTFNLDHEARTLHVRQEVRVTEEGMSQLWTGVVQGQAGHTLFNSRHFAKATLTTPTDVYYTADGDISSAVSGVESVIAAISLSAGSGSNTTYLLMWDLDLQQSHSSGPSMVDEDKSYMEDIMEENDKEEWLLFYLETLLRASTPATGELKLNIEAKKTLQLLPDKEHMPSEEITTDIKVITETMPELGRILGKLTRSVDAYTFNGRMWSEQQAVGIVSYGMARNNSLKSSHLLTVVDPTTSWGRLQLVIETDHLGSFPDNFQSSIGGKGSVGMEEAGQVRALVLRTPAASSITLALITYLQELPGGSFFLKWSEVAVQSHITWALMKCTMGIQWQEGGKAMELVLNYVNPSTALHALDTSITFSISQAPYPPLTFILASRVSVNADHHYILNIDCRSQQEQYMITWAFMHPGGGGSVRLQLRHVGDTYGVLAVIVLQGFSLQVTGAFTSVAVGEELLVTMYSSLLKDPRGRTIRIFRKSESGKMEIAAFFSLGGDSPDWIYSYRLLVEMERDIKQKVRYLKAEDRFTYYHLHQLLNDYQFLILTVYNNFDEVELELEFPNFGSQVKVIGSLLKGKDSQLELVINTPSFTHLIDGRLIFGSSEWWSAHSGTFNYNLQKKKGRENPFKLKLEASKWNSNRQKYKFFVQKTHLESSVSSSIYEMLYEYPYETYNHPGYSYDDSVASTSISTFDVAVDVSRDPGTTEYKATWQTDKTKNEVRVVLEKDPSGGGALLRYFRQVKGIPKSEVKYQLKGNYRRIDTELTISCTLDQSSITRPRAIIFLHSEAECYAELLLDLFEEEADQVILVITYFSHNLRFRIGQFGNTFLQLGYQEETDNEGTTLHKVQVESSGRTVEVWVGMMPEEQRTCIKAGVVLETPTLAPTHHLLLLCPAPTPELTIQLMGLEEHEGPYVRMGQISGPGGVGVQVGSGRLQPLDTPPALTLTADVEKEVLEILIDWQSRSLAQFKVCLS
nr:uncharacterized protein LOC128696388 isoform X1 [Cherax quadricarinatus]